jgi:hypothetical protein
MGRWSSMTIGRDLKGSNCGLFEGIVPVFFWKYWEKTRYPVRDFSSVPTKSNLERYLRTKLIDIGLGVILNRQPFFLSTAFKPCLGPTQPPIQWVPGLIFSGVKQQLTSIIKCWGQEWWSYASTAPASSWHSAYWIKNRYNPSSRIMALGSTQPLTEMSTRYLPEG